MKRKYKSVSKTEVQEKDFYIKSGVHIIDKLIIRKGDWYIDKSENSEPIKSYKTYFSDDLYNKQYFKIIATSNKELNLPLISEKDATNIAKSKTIRVEMDTFAGVLPDKPEGKGWNTKFGEALAFYTERPVIEKGFVKVKI